MKVIDALLADFAKHGKAAIDILRVEQPAQYVRICSDIAARWAIAERSGLLAGHPVRHPGEVARAAASGACERQ